MIKNVIKQIDMVATSDPTRIVYNNLGETNTYQQLKEKSDALASHIIELDLDKKSPIMVYGNQKFEMLVAFMGSVKAGHAYIPIDSHSPAERLEEIQNIAKPAACIAVAELPEIELSVPVISHTELVEIIENGQGTVVPDPSLQVKGNDNFYIIFTSGTTGQPKGVQISHDNLISYVNWMIEDFSLPERPNILSQAPYSFDLSVMDVYPALTMGGQLSVLPQEVTDNFKVLFQTLPTLDLQVWVSTPSFMDICLLEPTFDADHLPDLSRFLFCGEELTHKTASALKKRFPMAKIFNTYGPTEATVAVSSVEITNDILEAYPRLPIGYSKADTKMVVVNSKNEVVPNGDEGELIIIGPSVSKGYINNPDKTASAFFEMDDGNAYRTGDAATISSDGMLLYRGRIDFQVKLHGYRIELEEVDHHVASAPYVKQAITIPKYDKDHKVSQLIAYVVQKEHPFDRDIELTAAIKKDMAETTMSYMIPQKFVYVDSLPLTQNGKIDRKKLINEVNA
ncbi:D-alanine--poly(phosphoribitol) ligase subunit DltA [Dellaglioa carnosa]|uniref:D-alanine--poly(phosphoribitol) ligase subunit DltA n=1 Tax=Dellaglioa carnosa TaxID=2995136 RepID=UPI0022A8B32A|nr:D-alanine--poly(phosphoribitol) ligase subunit DltA [Dellaglioa carnosa]MCZ2492284.1 D-alanine--poly(phosphoribitol) ligase subunit DltA [Dellaglioa carnosa]